MTRPFAELAEIVDGREQNEISREEFREGRRKLTETLFDVSGLTQQQFATRIGISSSMAQKILSQPVNWTQARAITRAIGLPEDCSLSDVATISEFIEHNPIYINSIDAVTHFIKSIVQESGLMPGEFILQRIEDSREIRNSDKENLLAYFKAPSTKAEPSKLLVKSLELALGVPVRSISAPQEVLETRAQVTWLSRSTRALIASNVRAAMDEELLTLNDLAARAGLSAQTVEKLLTPPHTLSLNSFFAISNGLALENPASLMMQPGATLSEQPKEFEGLPLVVRAFLIDYMAIVRETTTDEPAEPTGRATAVLLLTPLLHAATRMIEQHAAMSPSGIMPDLASLLGSVERHLRSQH